MKPIPAPDEVSEFYWEAAARGELAVAACVPHGHLNYPPDVSCSTCGARELEPRVVSGRGTVYSFTVVRQAFTPAFAADVPYVIALVELAEQGGLRLLTNLVEVAPEAVAVGDAVHVVFEERGEQWLPQFAPDGSRT
jgi:hypothetical protein